MARRREKAAATCFFAILMLIQPCKMALFQPPEKHDITVRGVSRWDGVKGKAEGIAAGMREGSAGSWSGGPSAAPGRSAMCCGGRILKLRGGSGGEGPEQAVEEVKMEDVMVDDEGEDELRLTALRQGGDKNLEGLGLGADAELGVENLGVKGGIEEDDDEEEDPWDTNKPHDPLEWRDGVMSSDGEFEKELEQHLANEEAKTEPEPNFEYMRMVGEDTPEEKAIGMVSELRRRGQEGGSWATQIASPRDGGLEGQLLVPDDVENVPAAVKAAAFVEDGDDPVGIFVRKGIHRWDAEITVYQRFDLDMPPGVEFLQGVMQNTSNHYVYQSRLEMFNSTRKRARVVLSGDSGALLWGRWIFERWSDGSFSNVQLLSDSMLAGQGVRVHDVSAATFEAVSANVSFSQCGIKCVKGVCLRVAETSNVRVIECAVGGLGPDEDSLCGSCVTVWDQSRAAIGRSVLADGAMGSAGLRLCGEAEVAARSCGFERLFTAVCLHNKGMLSVVDCTFINQTHSALFAGGEQENGTVLAMHGCTIDSMMWADDGRPGKFREENTTMLGGKSNSEIELQRMIEENEQMERQIEELNRMKDPEDMLMELLGRPGQEFDDEAGIEGINEDSLKRFKEQIRHLRRVVTQSGNMSKSQIVEELGPDPEGWLVDSDEEGAAAKEDPSWDSSDEQGPGIYDQDVEEREMARTGKLLSWILKSVEKVPEYARGDDDRQLLHDVPAMLGKLEGIKRQYGDEPHGTSDAYHRG